MIRGIFFELDGTLLEFEPIAGRAARAALFHEGAQRSYAFLTSRGCALPSFADFCHAQRAAFQWAQWVTWLTGTVPNGRRALRRMCAQLGLQRDERSLARLGWLWYEPTAQSARLPDDVVPTLAALRDAQIRLGLVLNTPHMGAVIDRHLDDAGLLGFFSVRAYSSELGVARPHPRIFQIALREMGLPPREALWVGKEVIGARRAGMQTALLAQHPPRARRRGADHVIARISDLLALPALHCARAQSGAVQAA
jgi:FMN phosphatase YigB (HAD superfamily)